MAAGTILGGLWADVSWGRFWGWDPKEVWALISLLTYLAILHGRYAGWFGDFGLAVGSVLGATAIVFSWYGVNFVLGVGLHSYGFGAGGQLEVGLGVFVELVVPRRRGDSLPPGNAGVDSAAGRLATMLPIGCKRQQAQQCFARVGEDRLPPSSAELAAHLMARELLHRFDPSSRRRCGSRLALT